MHGVLQDLTLWTYYHPQWAGLVLFFISICETITIIGSIIPGSIIMIAVGTLIGANILPYWSMVLWAAAGAVVGDGLNFTLGYFVKDNLNKIWPFSVKQNWLAKGQTFFVKHGGKSVFLGRFVGPLRAFIPITAGAMHMPMLRFYIIDSLSALLWAATYVIPGILLGAASLALPPDIASHFILFVFLTLLAIVIALWLIRLSYMHISDVVKHALGCLWQFMKKSPSFDHLCKLFRHYREDHPRGQLTAVLMWCLLTTALITLSIHVFTKGALTQFNPAIFHFFNSIRNLPTDKLAILASGFGDKEAISVVFAVVFIWFCYRRCWRAALHWAFLTVLTYMSIALLKHGIQSIRPNSFRHSYSFPSGHTTLATVLYGGIAYFTASRWPERARWLCYLCATIAVILIALSRIYLGAHWLTDVFGGMLLGSWCLVTMIFSYQRHVTQRIKPIGLLVTSLGTLLISVGIFTGMHMQKSLIKMQPVWPAKTINISKWWSDNGTEFPLFVTNRFGTPQNRLTIQWASNILTINKTLSKKGWHHPIAHNWATAIQHPEESHHFHLYLKTLLFRDKKPEFLFVKQIEHDKYTLALRLWRTEYHFNSYPQSLWAGILSIHSNNPEQTPMPLNGEEIKYFLDALDTQAFKLIDLQMEDTQHHHIIANSQLLMIKPKAKTKIKPKIKPTKQPKQHH